jgi:hypothetical protein
MKIRLLDEIEGYMTVFPIGMEFEEDEPYQGFNDDGSFTICQGKEGYINVPKEKYEKIIY